MFGHPYAILRTPTRYPFIAIFEPCRKVAKGGFAARAQSAAARHTGGQGKKR
jgi:hypothetical protein